MSAHKKCVQYQKLTAIYYNPLLYALFSSAKHVTQCNRGVVAVGQRGRALPALNFWLSKKFRKIFFLSKKCVKTLGSLKLMF